MEKWFVASKRADFNKIGEVFHISPVTARLMRNRDLTTIEEMQRYLYGSLSDLYDPHLLKDADKGAEIIKEKIEAGKKIRIISDYDVDGVSSNYILYQGLKRCGADVDYKIPDRVEDGYGINEHLIEQAAEDGIDTIITCDNGIAASAQIAYGNSLGLTIVVTDHHDIPFQKENDEITDLFRTLGKSSPRSSAMMGSLPSAPSSALNSSIRGPVSHLPVLAVVLSAGMAQ